MDFRKTAATIDVEVRRLTVQGLSRGALAERMIPYWPDMHEMWNTLSDRQLMLLIQEFPYFGRFGEMLEDITAAAPSHVSEEARSTPQLAEPLKQAVTGLLKEAAELESEYRRLSQMSNRVTAKFASKPVVKRYQSWVQNHANFMDSLPVQELPEISRRMLVTLFDPISKRLDQHAAFLGK